eukprot:8124103-Alexandrium_andersonii.AAC.1
MSMGMRQTLFVAVSSITSMLPQRRRSEIARPLESKRPVSSFLGNSRGVKKLTRSRTEGTSSLMALAEG